jgi:hypothetical protein
LTAIRLHGTAPAEGKGLPGLPQSLRLLDPNERPASSAPVRWAWGASFIVEIEPVRPPMPPMRNFVLLGAARMSGYSVPSIQRTSPLDMGLIARIAARS